MKTVLQTSLTELEKELKLSFLSPISYLFLVIFLVVLNLLTFTHGQFFERGEAELAAAFFKWHPILYAFLIPALCMRIWAEENRQGTHELLFSHPVSLRGLVLGKFLSIASILLIALLSTLILPISVDFLGNPDWGLVFSGYFGSYFMALSFAAICCYCSALANSQVTSFISGMVICIMLILFSSDRVTKEFIAIFPDNRQLVDLFSWVGVNQYYKRFILGAFELKSLLYFSAITIIFLTLNLLFIKSRQFAR